jgi:hypothetical protein
MRSDKIMHADRREVGQSCIRYIECRAVNSRTGFLASFSATGFFFSLDVAFGFPVALEAAAFFVPAFAPVAPAVVFLAVGFFDTAAAAVNERRGVPVRNVRRVKDGEAIGVVATRARATPRTADDVPKRQAIRWVSSVNIVLSERECGHRSRKYFDGEG